MFPFCLVIGIFYMFFSKHLFPKKKWEITERTKCTALPFLRVQRGPVWVSLAFKETAAHTSVQSYANRGSEVLRVHARRRCCSESQLKGFDGRGTGSALWQHHRDSPGRGRGGSDSNGLASKRGEGGVLCFLRKHFLKPRTGHTFPSNHKFHSQMLQVPRPPSPQLGGCRPGAAFPPSSQIRPEAPKCWLSLTPFRVLLGWKFILQGKMCGQLTGDQLCSGPFTLQVQRRRPGCEWQPTDRQNVPVGPGGSDPGARGLRTSRS